jgi:hypothetical protein
MSGTSLNLEMRLDVLTERSLTFISLEIDESRIEEMGHKKLAMGLYPSLRNQGTVH